jgi:hypothetical protein
VDGLGAVDPIPGERDREAVVAGRKLDGEEAVLADPEGPLAARALDRDVAGDLARGADDATPEEGGSRRGEIDPGSGEPDLGAGHGHDEPVLVEGEEGVEERLQSRNEKRPSASEVVVSSLP